MAAKISSLKKVNSLQKGALNPKLFKVILVFITFFVFLSTALLFSQQVEAAFSSYERSTSEAMLKDLNRQYDLREYGEDDKEYQILNRLKQNIASRKFREAEFKIYHVDDELINAYYIGDGRIILFEGLVSLLESDDQLAALIAHEIGHGVEGHLDSNLKRNLSLSLISILFNRITDREYQTMTNVAYNLINNGYSREQEREADIFAVDLMIRADYDPQALIELMKIFKERSHNIKLLEFTQTHPIPDSRIEYISQYIAEKQANESIALKNEPKEEASSASKEEQTDKEKFQMRNTFKADIVSFRYPADWELNQRESENNEQIFSYEFKADKLEGEFILFDYSARDFMQTAEKNFDYALIRAEAEDYIVNRAVQKTAAKNVYRLQKEKDSQIFIEYYIDGPQANKVLNLNFSLAKDDYLAYINQLNYLINSLKIET